MNLESRCGPTYHKYLAPRLISNFKGAMAEYIRSMEVNSTDYQVPNGVELLLAFIHNRLNIRELDLEAQFFNKYFHGMMRKQEKH